MLLQLIGILRATKIMSWLLNRLKGGKSHYHITLTREPEQCVPGVFGITLIDLACFLSPLLEIELLKCKNNLTGRL